ncbi:MAG: phenylacetate-CoA oxygenase subunit PaaI [Planctomycetota bacterium]|nr:MAG: phenylacetate-CoA oxygenase subunit PaaI [Planctomycetota bacterium]
MPGAVRAAVVDLLYRLADDELVIGHRDSEWTGLAPILEEDVAFSSMAQDEMGHARAYYQMLEALGEGDPDTLAFTRKPRAFRCASLVSLPNDRDWGFCIMRQFLYDAAETVRLTALAGSTLAPLAQLAAKLRSEEKYHLMHGRGWVLRLGKGTEESRDRMQEALQRAYPHALGLFEPTSADETLAQHGICPKEGELKREWESAVAPVLDEAGLSVPDPVEPVHGGRVGRHPDALKQLLDDLQLVHNIDPSAQW